VNKNLRPYPLLLIKSTVMLCHDPFLKVVEQLAVEFVP